MKGNTGKAGFSADRACAALIIVTLIAGVFMLWQRVADLNGTIVDLDYKLQLHKLQTANPDTASENPLGKVSADINQLGQAPHRPSMYELGMKSGTDKVGHHGYDRFYPFFLEHLRDVEGLKMLEIGYNLGKSYQMWLEYFPKGSVYFMEKDEGSKFREARYTGDQGKVADLDDMLDKKKMRGKLDFIIDDGSHHPVHQMVSFLHLFQHGLKPGGVYIIEDTETSYWRSGNTYGLSTAYGKDHPDSAINRMKGLIDVVNRRYQPDGEPFTSTFGKEIDDTVQSIFFGPNAVVIIKMAEDEMVKYSPKSYLWKDKLKKPVV